MATGSLPPGRWKLEDAKARFSEVVRRAQRDGPQRVSVRGREAVVVVSAEDWNRLVPREPGVSLLDFMQSLDLDGIDLEREIDHGRDVPL